MREAPSWLAPRPSSRQRPKLKGREACFLKEVLRVCDRVKKKVTKKKTSKKKATKKKKKLTRRPLPAKKKKVQERALAVIESFQDLPAPQMEVAQQGIQAYLTALRKYPLLDPESEYAIADHYQRTQDPEAAKILILANLRLVVKIAGDYTRSGIQLLDLIQEGNVGLIQAINEYDPYRGVKFSSYASYWIKAYIRSFILRNWSLVKMGTTRAQRALFYKLQKEKQNMEAMGIRPSRKALAEKFDVKEREVDEMSQRMGSRDLSLNTPVRKDASDSDELIQLIEDPTDEVTIQLAESEIKKEFSERLDYFEKTLSGKELVIFRERLRADQAKTLREIGENYGITRERVRQIEARVLEKLREYMKQNAKFMENVIDV